MTCDALRRLVLILVQRGCSPSAIRNEVELACAAAAASVTTAPPPTQQLVDSAHVLTLWFEDPAYTGADGAPLPLPTFGPVPSIEALARQVNPNGDVGEILRSLLKSRSVRRVGSRHVPRKRAQILRNAEDIAHSLEGLFGLLRTLEHNGWGPRDEPRLEVYSLNRNVPVSEVPKLERKLRQMGERTVVQSDTALHVAETERNPGEPTVHMGIGVYQWIIDPATFTAKSPRPR